MFQIIDTNFFSGSYEPAISIRFQKVNCNIEHNSGIYRIYNTITKDCYIGQSKDIAKRIQEHKNLLQRNKHTYRNGQPSLLQKAWNKYGQESFRFEIIDKCSIEELDDAEQFWIQYFQCNRAKTNNGYNLTDGGHNFNGFCGLKYSIRMHNDETEIMVKPQDVEEYFNNGFKIGVLPGSRGLSGEKHYMYGKHHSEEHNQKVREKLLGRTLSDEDKAKISQGRKKSVVQLTKQYDFIREFNSGLDAEQDTGVNRAHICQCCKHERKSAGGFIWRYKNEYVETLS
jgi:group I intron endonuclease